PGGSSLWPGIEAAVAMRLDRSAARAWLLAERILERLAGETRAGGASLVVIDIPYLPQVYDDVWGSSFRGIRGHDRFIAGRRLGELCARHDIAFIDPTPAFIRAARASHRWLHYRADRHPTAEGQQLIAREVASDLRVHARLEAPGAR